MSVADALDTLTTASARYPLPGEEDQVRMAAAVIVAAGIPEAAPPSVRLHAAAAVQPLRSYRRVLVSALHVAEYRFLSILADDPERLAS